MKRIYLSLGSNIGDREGNLRKAVEHFAVYEAGPIRIAVTIATFPDSGLNEVYVPHLPVPAVQAMLEEWGVRPSNLKKHRYKRLRSPSLEDLYALRTDSKDKNRFWDASPVTTVFRAFWDFSG